MSAVVDGGGVCACGDVDGAVAGIGQVDGELRGQGGGDEISYQVVDGGGGAIGTASECQGFVLSEGSAINGESASGSVGVDGEGGISGGDIDGAGGTSCIEFFARLLTVNCSTLPLRLSCVDGNPVASTWTVPELPALLLLKVTKSA